MSQLICSVAISSFTELQNCALFLGCPLPEMQDCSAVLFFTFSELQNCPIFLLVPVSNLQNYNDFGLVTIVTPILNPSWALGPTRTVRFVHPRSITGWADPRLLVGLVVRVPLVVGRV